METMADFIFLGSKIILDCDCSNEIKMLALGRKAMTNLDSILKSKGFLYFHTNLEIICSSSVKNVAGSLIGIALNL